MRCWRNQRASKTRSRRRSVPSTPNPFIDEAMAALELLTEFGTVDISGVVCRHTAIRRHLMAKSVQTQSMNLGGHVCRLGDAPGQTEQASQAVACRSSNDAGASDLIRLKCPKSNMRCGYETSCLIL